MASTVVNVAKLSCTLNRKTAAKHNVSTSVQTLCVELMPKSLILVLVGLKVTDCNLCATWAQQRKSRSGEEGQSMKLTAQDNNFAS